MCIYIFLTILSVFAKMAVGKLINERKFLLIVGLLITFCRFSVDFSGRHLRLGNEKWRPAAKLRDAQKIRTPNHMIRAYTTQSVCIINCYSLCSWA